MTSAASAQTLGIVKMIDERIISIAVTALATAAAGYFGVTAPAQQKSDLNRDANWSCRDQLVQITTERDEWVERYLEREGP